METYESVLGQGFLRILIDGKRHVYAKNPNCRVARRLWDRVLHHTAYGLSEDPDRHSQEVFGSGRAENAKRPT